MKCLICNKKIKKLHRTTQRFCSRQCFGKYAVGKRNHNYKGICKDKGYIYIYMPSHPKARHGRYVKRAVLVMEQILKRYLKPEERVHHINGIKTDDKPKNLKLYSNESAHIKEEWRKRRQKSWQVIKKGKYIKCLYCKKSFYVYPYDIKEKRKFCSVKCYRQYIKIFGNFYPKRIPTK